MRQTSTKLSRARESFRYYVGGIWRLLNEKQVFLWAQAIAFKVLVTTVPVVIIATGVLGLVLKREQAFSTVANLIRNFLPAGQGAQIIEFLRTLGNAGGTITVIGGLGLLFSVITLFSTLRVVVANAFHEEWHRQRTIWQGYVFDVRMTAQVGLLFLLTVGFTAGMQALGAAGTTFMEDQGYRWMAESWGRLFAIFGLLVPFLLSLAMFFQLYYLVPRPHPPVRAAFSGALVTAILWEIAKYLFAFYATRVGRFEYDANPTDEGLGPLVNSFGLLLAFVFWVYYSGLVLSIGAFIGLLSEKRIRTHRKQQHMEKLRGKGSSRRAAAVLVLLAIGLVPESRAQHPLILVNDETTVRGINFEFAATETFEPERLEQEIATRGPGFWDRVKKVLPLMSARDYPFDPVELQRDVVRLRRFYQNNGFLHPSIDYAGSRLDTTNNTIRVIFSINEGPPVLVQDIGYFGPDSTYAFYLFEGEQREAWTKFQEATTVHTGERYTDFDRIRIQDQVLSWLKNSGYAFAEVQADISVDSVANTADLRFQLNPGPVAYYDSIIVEGNESVERNVIMRELPFHVGQRFNNKRVTEAQRELFALSLFRSALTDVPEQPRDSTVTVRVRVREAKLRYVNAQTGYNRDNGLGAQGSWTHRNFLGGARTFTATLVAQTGVMASPSGGMLPSTLYRGAISLRQPYLFVNRLSATISPYFQVQRDPNLTPSNEFLRLNVGEIGNATSFLYEIYPFRTVNVQHNFSQSLQVIPTEFDTASTSRTRDYFLRSVVTTSAVLGKVNDFFNPSRGFLVRPFADVGGAILGSDVQFARTGTEVTAYQHLRFGLTGAVRVYVGQFWALGKTKRQLGRSLSPADSAILENRLDPIMFYAGGSNDVRGWGLGMAGNKVPRVNQLANGRDFISYEALGGDAKFAGSLELRSRFPGLSSAWRGAAFVDVGALGDKLGRWDTWKTGVGAGIRYVSPIGLIRLDLAYKLNPDYEDLREPESVYYHRQGLEGPPKVHRQKRWGLHLSIGQAF